MAVARNPLHFYPQSLAVSALMLRRLTVRHRNRMWEAEGIGWGREYRWHWGLFQNGQGYALETGLGENAPCLLHWVSIVVIPRRILP